MTTYPWRPYRGAFSKRHYEALALALSQAKSQRAAVAHIAHMLADDSVRFDRARFERAANRKGARQ